MEKSKAAARAAASSEDIFDVEGSKLTFIGCLRHYDIS
jgi:hypothetical protein